MYFHLMVWQNIHLNMAGLLNFARSLSKTNLTIAGVCGLGGLFAADRYLKYRANTALLTPIMEKLKEGSKPYLPLTHMMERKDIWEPIERTFLTGIGRQNEGFGIVFGPSGSGKTMATRKVCNDHPEGVIYIELKGMSEDCSFVEEMTDQLGLKTKPTGIIDLILGHFSHAYVTHHQLPKDDPWASMDYIFRVLIRVSMKYKLRHNKMPVVFIDGCDALAKDNARSFARLVYLAKVLINDKILRIVFVSSEGSIIPEIQKSSAINRCATLHEIGDIDDKQAVKYLCQHNVPVGIAKGVVETVGGRFVYLKRAMLNYHTAKLDASSGRVSCVEEITRDIINFKTKPQKTELIKHKEIGEIILEQLRTKGYIKVDDFKNHDRDIKKIEEAIKGLLGVNLIRYNKDLDFTWHSRIEENVFKS